MTRRFLSGAETGHIHAEGLAIAGGGTHSFDTGTFRSGARSSKHDSGAGNLIVGTQHTFAGVTGRTYYATLWFNVVTLPSSNTELCRFQAGVTALCRAGLTTGGKVRLLDQAGTQIGSDSSATVSTGTWYRLDLSVRIDAGAADDAECRLDGATVASTATGAFTDSAPDIFRYGWVQTNPGANRVLYMDDIVINDDQGSDNNTWADDEHIVLLLPTADNTLNNWTGGAGGTTTIFEAVNNIPPVGVDTAVATNTSQIENLVSAANNGYRADMTTYSAAGLTSGDTVTAILPVAEGGNDSTTGTDTIDIGVISNPAITQVSQSIDVNDGTYPTGWNRCVGTMTENPSVTLGTAPVMIVEKNVATTRVNTVCFMGMYVSYIDGAPPAAGSRGPQVIFIMALLLCALGSIDVAWFWIA